MPSPEETLRANHPPTLGKMADQLAPAPRSIPQSSSMMERWITATRLAILEGLDCPVQGFFGPEIFPFHFPRFPPRLQHSPTKAPTPFIFAFLIFNFEFSPSRLLRIHHSAYPQRNCIHHVDTTAPQQLPNVSTTRQLRIHHVSTTRPLRIHHVSTTRPQSFAQAAVCSMKMSADK